MNLEQESPLSTCPAPPELIARAEALVKEYDAQCFWFRHPEAKISRLGDVRLVITFCLSL